MSDNQIVSMVVFALAAQGVALVLALVLRQPVPLLAVNLVFAAGVLVYDALHPRFLASPIDWQIAGLGIFEIVAVIAAIAAWWRVPLTVPVSCVVFALHFAASIALLVFMLTFKLTRLI